MACTRGKLVAKKRKKAPRRKRTKTARTVARRTRVPTLDFEMFAQGEDADPTPVTKRLLERALAETLKGTPTVIIKGMTRHHCQTQLVPKFSDMAEAAGLRIASVGLGQLRAGDTLVLFQPLVTVETEGD